MHVKGNNTFRLCICSSDSFIFLVCQLDNSSSFLSTSWYCSKWSSLSLRAFSCINTWSRITMSCRGDGYIGRIQAPMHTFLIPAKDTTALIYKDPMYIQTNFLPTFSSTCCWWRCMKSALSLSIVSLSSVSLSCSHALSLFCKETE